MPKVSVIVLTYNRPWYLRRAIRSVLDQTFQDFELIIVDDASTAATGDIVLSLSDSRIRYFRNDTNRGEAYSRNRGIRNSAGAYIAFLDDDDLWLTTKLEVQMRVLEASPVCIGAVYGSFLSIDGKTEKVLGSWMAQKRGNVLEALIEKNWIGIPSTIILRRQCFNSVGLFDEEVEFGPDYDMWIRVAKQYEFEFIREPLVLRSVNHSRMSTDYALMLRGKEAKMKKHQQLLSSNKRAYGLHFLRLGILYCYNGELRKGQAAIMRAIQLNPLEFRNYYNLGLSCLGAKNFTKIKDLRDKFAFESYASHHY